MYHVLGGAINPAAGDGPGWLPDVSALLQDLGDRIESLCDGEGRSGVRYGTEVARVVVERDGAFTTCDAAGARLVTSRSLVVAAGARERVDFVQGLAPPGAAIVESISARQRAPCAPAPRWWWWDRRTARSRSPISYCAP